VISFQYEGICAEGNGLKVVRVRKIVYVTPCLTHMEGNLLITPGLANGTPARAFQKRHLCKSTIHHTLMYNRPRKLDLPDYCFSAQFARFKLSGIPQLGANPQPDNKLKSGALFLVYEKMTVYYNF